MNSPDVAAALSTGAPDAAGKLYDAHAEALFQFCWLTLRDRQQARTAVCDALVQAGARVAELSDPATLRAWLFALVRAECHRHPLPSLGDTDEPVARPEQRDAALRIMAWNSVMSLDRVQRQALDLATRHGMTEAEIALILGLPLAGTTELLATTRTELEQALGAEILVSRDRLECPGRTGAIHGWTGTVTPQFRARVLDHAGSCEVCRPKLPRNVSAGRIFGLLPAPALDREARAWVIGRVGDLVLSQAAEADPAPAAPLRQDPLGGRPDPLADRVDPAPADRVDPARAEPVIPDPVIPDPVVPDPVVPDPAVAEPVLPDPAASPHIVSEDREPAVPAGPAEPAVPVERATPGLRAAVTPNPRAAAAPRPKTPPSDRTAATPGPGQRRRRFGPRVFAGLGAAVAAAAVAAGLTLGGAGGSHARLSGSDSQLVPSSVEQSQTGAGQPDPRPDAPPSKPGHGSRQHGTAATTIPAVGGADAVASGKQAGMDAAGAGRAGDQSGQTRRTVTVALAPSTQAARPGGPATTQAAARLTVSPASLNLGPGSSGALSLTVSGGSMSWSAAASSSSVSLSPASGYLGSNGSASVDVTVQRAGNSGGSASVSIDGAVVSVSWAATTPASSASSASSAPSGSSGSSGASGSAGSSPPPVRRHHQPHPGGSPGPAGS